MYYLMAFGLLKFRSKALESCPCGGGPCFLGGFSGG